MKIKLTDQELTRLGLIKEERLVPSLGEDYSVDVDTEGSINNRVENYDSDNLSLASINSNKNLLVGDLKEVAFTGSYKDLKNTPLVANMFNEGDGFLISKEDYLKLANLDAKLHLKSDISHTHKFKELTEVPLASKTGSGLMSEVHYRLLDEGLSKVATTGMYSDLNGKPTVATAEQDGLLSKELFREINAVAETFGSSFTQNSNGIYVYNHSHDISDIYGIEDVVERCNINIDNIIRTTEDYSSIFAGYDDEGNFFKGLMRGEDKEKLDRIDNNANYYVHPEKHNVTMIDGLSPVAMTGAYSDLLGTPDIIGTINSLDSQNGIALGSTGGLQIRRDGLPRISFQRGIQYFHDANVATKATTSLSEDNENQLEYFLAAGVNFNVKNDTGSLMNIVPHNTSFANCELEVTGNVTLKHSQDPDATGYNGLVLGTDTNHNSGNVYGVHSMGIIADHTIGFGNKTYGSEEYTAFINTRNGDMYLKGDIYIQGTINSAYKDETLDKSVPSLQSNSQTITRSIPAIAESLGVSIDEDGDGRINMSNTILALLDKIEELSDTIERHEIRIRQMEKELY